MQLLESLNILYDLINIFVLIMDVKFKVEFEGEEQEVEGPLDVSLSVMELLKAYEYPIEATCGGMGLCGSCHCFVDGDTSLFPIGDDEADTLDNIPFSNNKSRLSCQIRVHASLEGAVFHLKPGS